MSSSQPASGASLQRQGSRLPPMSEALRRSSGDTQRGRSGSRNGVIHRRKTSGGRPASARPARSSLSHNLGPSRDYELHMAINVSSISHISTVERTFACDFFLVIHWLENVDTIR